MSMRDLVLHIARLKKYSWLVSLIFILIIGGIFFILPNVQTPRPQLNAPTLSPTGIGKIILRDEGMYALTHQDLSRLGLESIHPSELRLYNHGLPQPLWYSGEANDVKIYFYGQSIENVYTRDNVYLLTSSANPIANTQSPITNTQLLTSFPPLRLEENILYAPKTEPEQTWFWKSLTAPNPESFDFTLSNLGEGEFTLRVSLFSTTEASSISPDHHLKLFLNDTLVSDYAWDGRGRQIIEEILSMELLMEGANTLTIEIPGDTGAVVETVLLDWIEMNVPHQLKADQGYIAFMGSGDVLELTGLGAAPWIFDLSHQESAPSVELSPTDSLLFPTQLAHLYVAVDPDGFLSPVALTSVQLFPDLQTAQAAYIAIGPPDLLEPLQPLLAYRDSLGINTLAVPVETIYDQFGNGIADPRAIRTFLQFALDHWEAPPEYVLLVGDSTYDPRGYQAAPEANRVPSFFRFTFFGGETSSDILFTQFDADNLPDLAIGRIPARTPEQVAIMVEKTLAYEKNPPIGNWVRRVLAVADGQEASFQGDAETFLSYFPEEYTSVLLSPPKGDTSTPGQIADILEEGVLLMSYFGHGSVTMLGRDRIFSVEDSITLTNAPLLPIMINITCLAGLFTHPEVESLTETMLWNREGGAVAALSATSLTVPADQAFLSKALIETLAQNPEATLGQLLLMAQRQLPVDQEGVREVMETFLLFGDPALNLP